jgi:hypothetical protein
LVTGKTNLSAGTDLTVKVIPVSMDSVQIASYLQNPEISTMTKVVRGSGPDNLFSVSLDTGILPLSDHIVTITGGTVTGTAIFNVIASTNGTGTLGSDAASYIKIDPVADQTTGDLLIVSGSTNLPAGTILMVQLPGFGGDTIVRAGTGGVNRFSSPVDSSILAPGALSITVTEMKGDPAKGNYGLGTIKGTAPFTLKGTPLSLDLPVQPTASKDDYIRIDPIGDRSAGDQFLVTGSTSLPVGTNILWQVTPKALTADPNMRGIFSGMMANSMATKGKSAANRVTYALDTNALLPGEYTVSAALLVGDPGKAKSGEPEGSAEFTVK